MSDYAGAKAAIRARLVANWPTTQITYQNEQPAAAWPPVDGDGLLVPWVHLEIVTSRSGMHGAGKPGSQVWLTDGLILVHVFVPQGTGDALATEYANAVGEIFRAKVFYNAGDGCYVRTWAPRVDEGGPATSAGDIEWANTGAWFRVSMSVPFEYWHRG